MFRFHKTLDVVTLFHKPTSAASTRVLNQLKQASANASQSATEDQASDHSHQSHSARTQFELNVTEEDPTSDQVRSILEYIGGKEAGQLVQGAKDEADAIKRLKENPTAFTRPVVVDWNNGRAVVGENKSKILKLLNALPKET